MFDGTGGVGGQQAAAFDKPYYHISLRLLRVVSVLVEKYYRLVCSLSSKKWKGWEILIRYG